MKSVHQCAGVEVELELGQLIFVGLLQQCLGCGLVVGIDSKLKLGDFVVC